MGAYAEQIANLKLVTLLERSAGRDGIAKTDVEQLHANVLKVADTAGRLLEAIPLTFRQYTEHNLTHSANLIRLMGDFIPAKTLDELNAVELAVLSFAALLHDLGMFVTDAERNQLLQSQDFVRFLNADPEKEHAIAEAEATGRRITVRAIEDAVIADYFRRLHPERVRQQIDAHDDLRTALRFREQSLVDSVSRICESHGWGVYESTDPRHPEKTIRQLKPRQRIYGVRFNEQYIAAALRLADIMDFDRSRTPLALLKTIDFTEPKSQAEWEKHLSIKGWEVTDRDVAFQAECTKPEHYVAVMEFLGWIDAELRDCRRLLVRDAPKDVAERYLFQLPPAVDRIHVEMEDKSFIAGAFRFELDYERIMKLLMDRSLYPDPSLFLRELLQNSLDACRVRMALARYDHAGDRYRPEIAVRDETVDGNRVIVFQDNGVGMSRAILENYFMRVGRSYYRSNEFHAERKRLLERDVELEATSQFGIGFLSCFMVADRIEIETYRHGYQPLHVLIEGATKYFTIRVVDDASPPPQFAFQGETIEKDGPPVFPGTRVTLHLRPGAKVDVLQTLETFAVNIEVPVAVMTGEEERVEVPAYRWRRDPMQFLEDIVDPDLVPTWADILVPLEVPLRSYDFCDGIDGRAWFWMLKGPDGQPTPRLNHLQIASGGISPAGLPAQVRRLAHNNRPRVSVEQEWPSSFDVPDELRAFWSSSDIPTRTRLLQHAESPMKSVWYFHPKAIQALAAPDRSWLDVDTEYKHAFAAEGSTSWALHGISLPGGVTQWDPMRGSAYSSSFIYFPLGFAIDVRKGAPTPAANRLFVSPQDAAVIVVPILRAFTQAALDFADEHASNLLWAGWCEGFFEGFRSVGNDWLDHAVRPDYARVEKRLRFSRDLDGKTIARNRDELRAELGRFIMQRDLTISPINRVLLSKYAWRRTEDGDIEYDLDTERELPPLGRSGG